MAREFDGLVAVVTGGASGIGAAIARRLTEQGAQVAVLDLNPQDIADKLFAVQANVADDASVRAAIDSVMEHFGRLDIVINNAGIGAQGSVEDNTDDEWHEVYDINVVGMVRVSRAALPQRALYSATKGAVLSLTRAMAADHLGEGIRVNCVNPGTADTPWIGRLLDTAPDPAAERTALNARQPHGRLVTADEVAGAVVYLASPLSGSTTGTSLAVDGGMHELRPRPE